MTKSCKGTGYSEHSLEYRQHVTHANSGTVIRCANFHVVFWHTTQLKEHMQRDAFCFYINICLYTCVCMHMHINCEILKHSAKFVKTKKTILTVWTKRSIVFTPRIS